MYDFEMTFSKKLQNWFIFGWKINQCWKGTLTSSKWLLLKGLWGCRRVGLILDGTLVDESYLHFLQNQFEENLDDWTDQLGYFQQDTVLSHSQVVEILNNSYGERSHVINEMIRLIWHHWTCGTS